MASTADCTVNISSVPFYPYPLLSVITLDKDDEMGRFKLGSTAIVLFGPDVMAWDDKYQAPTPTVMDERMGKICKG